MSNKEVFELALHINTLINCLSAVDTSNAKALEDIPHVLQIVSSMVGNLVVELEKRGIE